MRVLLMHRDRDVALDREPSASDEALVQDLELGTLLGAMADGDEFLHDVAMKTVLAPLQDPDAIRYRQAVLQDCLEHPDVVRDMYALTTEAIVATRRDRIFSSREYPSSLVLSTSRRGLSLLSGVLERLRDLAAAHGSVFRSEGFSRLFSELIDQLDDDYLAEVRAQLRDLGFRHGTPISARLGRGLASAEHVLRRPGRHGWMQRLPLGGRASYGFKLDPDDRAGPEILGDLRARGIYRVADALGQATEHLLGYLTLMRAELAFYVACVNLHRRLTDEGEPMCFPEPAPSGEPALICRGLYDPCLSLRVEGRVVGNEVDADGKSLVMITGANEGGKSTFLRSLGLAQLMLQSGMFAPAEALRADVRSGVFTHFKREEDAKLESGKLDEELRRMSDTLEEMQPGALLLCNESFASTNEREGSEIARQLVHALCEVEVKVLFVTHMYDLAHSLWCERSSSTLFLRAQRLRGGERTFRVVPGTPLETSFGADLYRHIFGHDPDAVRLELPASDEARSTTAEMTAADGLCFVEGRPETEDSMQAQRERAR